MILCGLEASPAPKPVAAVVEAPLNPLQKVKSTLSAVGKGRKRNRDEADQEDMGKDRSPKRKAGIDGDEAWFLDAIDLLLKHGAEGGRRACEALKEHLRDDMYSPELVILASMSQ